MEDNITDAFIYNCSNLQSFTDSWVHYVGAANHIANHLYSFWTLIVVFPHGHFFFHISFIKCLNIPFCLLTTDTLEDPHKIFFAKKTKTFIHSNTVQDMILQANLKLKNKIPYWDFFFLPALWNTIGYQGIQYTLNSIWIPLTSAKITHWCLRNQ